MLAQTNNDVNTHSM